MTTKKLIRLNCQNSYTDTCGSTMAFGMVSRNETVDSKGYRNKQLITNLTTCRESLVHSIKGRLGDVKKDYEVDLENLRFVVAFGSKYAKGAKERVFYAKQVLNTMEKDAGWDTSVITTTKYKASEDITSYLITGSGNWMFAPQLISMFGLIIRSVYDYTNNHNKEQLDEEINTIEDVRTLFNKMVRASGLRDNDHVSTCRKHFYSIMKNHKEIFKEGIEGFLGIKPIEDYNYGTGYGGVTSFCQNNSGKLLTERFRKFVK